MPALNERLGQLPHPCAIMCRTNSLSPCLWSVAHAYLPNICCSAPCTAPNQQTRPTSFTFTAAGNGEAGGALLLDSSAASSLVVISSFIATRASSCWCCCW